MRTGFAVVSRTVISVFLSLTFGLSVAYAVDVYTDVPGANWYVSGWSATSSEQTSPVFQGTKSLAVQYTGEWGGFLFERLNGSTPSPISATEFTHVTFSVNPGATVSSNLASVVVHLNLTDGTPKPLVNYLPGNSWAANQWQTVRIPLADLNPNNTSFYRIVIQSQVQATGYGFSIDAASLDNGSTTPPPTQTLTVFGDAMAPQWALSPWSATAAIQNQHAQAGNAIKVDATTWGGINLDSRDANWQWFDQPGNTYTHLSFDVSAGATVGAAMNTLQASLDLGYGLSAKISDYVPSFAPNTWYHVEIPLSVLNPNSVSFRRVQFQNNSQSNLTFYVDNVALVSTGTPPPPPPPSGGSLQSCASIMPLGDSITAGLNGGYRNDVYTGLQQNSCGVSYVGTLYDENTVVADKDHEGHAGLDIAGIAADIDSWLTTTQPNIILLMIGTNNTAWWTNYDGPELGAQHNALLDQIRAARPNAWIFVASIPPQSSKMIHGKPDGQNQTTSVDRAVLTQDFNAAIRANVEARIAAGQNVRFVDVNAALTLSDISVDDGGVTGDGVHPIAAAYPKIAAKFLEAIRAALGNTSSSLMLDINTSASRTPISPYIYGVNDVDSTLRNLGAMRAGGNRFTGYNWENNYSNSGSDGTHSNDTYLIGVYGANTTPGSVASSAIQRAHNVGAAALITVPIVDWVAADALGDVKDPASSTNTRFHRNQARKPTAPTVPYAPSLSDRFVYQDEFVGYIEYTFANARAQGRQIFYSLDNEPDLWIGTHMLLREGCWANPNGANWCNSAPPPEPTRVTYAELISRTTQYGKMIKDMASSALTFGPASYGYDGFKSLQGASDARLWHDPSYNPADPEERHLDFLAYYLKQMNNAQVADGRRLLDVLDVHWYSEARSTPSNARVIFDATSCSNASDVVAARVQAPRSLWDPGYVENSWIAADAIGGPIRLIPRLKKIIADNYPGTKIAFTEYNHGCGNHISDAVAQADTLGIFGREGVYAAMFWAVGSDSFPNAAIKMFRDYDGTGGMVGDVAVAASTPDIAKISVYAMAHTGNNDLVDVVVINRQPTAERVTVRLTHPVTMSQVAVYQLAGTSTTPQPATGTVSQNQYTYDAPGTSVTTLVFRR